MRGVAQEYPEDDCREKCKNEECNCDNDQSLEHQRKSARSVYDGSGSQVAYPFRLDDRAWDRAAMYFHSITVVDGSEKAEAAHLHRNSQQALARTVVPLDTEPPHGLTRTSALTECERGKLGMNLKATDLADDAVLPGVHGDVRG